MKKCMVFDCSNWGIRWYLMDPSSKVWLCETCINQARQATSLEIAK